MLNVGGTFAGTSTASFVGEQIAPTLNFSGTGSYSALYIDPTETAVGSGLNYLLDAAVGGGVPKFVLTDGGNVGIGTINPLSKLNVNGGVGIGTTLTNGNYLNGNSAPAGGLIVQGNVGIGTWLPSSSLQVVGGGIQVGLPTGGDKGSGNINIAGDIYKNNAAYINPDYVFEKYFTGNIVQFKNNPGAAAYTGIRPIADVMTFTKLHHQLPLVASVNGRGLFGKGDGLLASLEESYIYIFDLSNQQKKTNDQIKTLQQENEELRVKVEELEKKMEGQQAMGNGEGNALPKFKQSLEKENNNSRTL